MPKSIMLCGHSSNAVNAKTNEPMCAICNETRTRIASVALAGRIAICMGCKHQTPSTSDSRVELPFFKHTPEKETDEYYCGCWGWD